MSTLLILIVMSRAHLIFHFASVVLDNESIFLSLRFLVKRIVFVNVVELVQEIFITATREANKEKFHVEEQKNVMDILRYSLARIVQNAQQSGRL